MTTKERKGAAQFAAHYSSSMQKQETMQRFHPLLWSKDAKSIDLEKDKVYIIHQVLAFGSLEDIRLLLQMYSKAQVDEVFIQYPKKIYLSSVFFFVKDFILNLRNLSLPAEKYVRTPLGDSR